MNLNFLTTELGHWPDDHEVDAEAKREWTAAEHRMQARRLLAVAINRVSDAGGSPAVAVEAARVHAELAKTAPHRVAEQGD